MTWPPDLQQFVRREIASGHFASEDELVSTAVRFLRDSHAGLGQLRAGIQARIASLDRGEGIAVDSDQAMGDLLDDIEAEVRRDLAAKDAQE